jgi:cytochrome c peroxidase
VGVFRHFFDWDGRAPSLAEQLKGVFRQVGDMGLELTDAVNRIAATPKYVTLFRNVYHSDPDGVAMIAALVAYQKSLVVSESRFDRFYLRADSSALTVAERRGWEVFRTSSCAGCHVPLPDPGGSGIIVFSEDRFHNLGVGYANGRMADRGRYDITHAPNDMGAFKTPTLRNVALTAPYMHDGSLKTLEAVIDFYARGGNKNRNLDPIIVPLRLSVNQKADLVAFLKSLTSEWLTDSLAVRRKFFPHSASHSYPGKHVDLQDNANSANRGSSR